MNGKGGKRTTSVQPSASSRPQVSSSVSTRAQNPVARLSASASVVGFIYDVIKREGNRKSNESFSFSLKKISNKSIY